MRFLIIVEYTDLAARERAVAAHRTYVAEGRRRGIVVDSGPFRDGRGGMYVLSVPDEAAAHAFVAADPYVKDARLHVSVRPYDSAQEKETAS